MESSFSQWVPLGTLTLSHLPRAGGFSAVYALSEIASGDILKFGCTGSLRRRIFGNYFGGIGGQTTKRIHAQLFENGMLTKVAIAWVETGDRAEAERIEKELRRNYTKVHGHRPPWDRLD
jgi:hypothetical protein